MTTVNINDMKPISIFGYIGLGCNIQLLRELAKENSPVHDDKGVLKVINLLLSGFDTYNLRVTVSASRTMSELIEKLQNTDNNYLLSSEDAINLNEAIEQIDPVLRAESLITSAFILTEKRMDLNKLMNDVPALFSQGTFNKLPDIAQYDFKEAGKCIALERPTAAAFHILRATESVLKQFYINTVKPNCTDNLMWGPMTDTLRKRQSSLSEELLHHLDHIRESFRNPTQHPEKIYTLDEAQDLFSLCEDVVNRMVS
jgi:hypothetical protein